MKILFLHGWRSVVGGVKPTYLQDAGHEVLNPKLDDENFDLALKTAQEYFDRHRPDVVVGSSRGGAVAINLRNTKLSPIVLLCPAWRNWGSVKQVSVNCVILHSPADEVIPFVDSQQLIAQSGLPEETLIAIGDDHRLADENSLAVMEWACRMLARGEQMPASAATNESSESGSRIGSASDIQVEGSYICNACGEEIVIPMDLSAGAKQNYVEDCPVCCRANVIHVQLNADGSPEIWVEPEQDG